MANKWDVGDLVEIEASCYDVNRTLTDPDEMFFGVRHEDETDPTVYEYDADDPASPVIRRSKGIYYVNVPATKPGLWHCRGEGRGAGQCADERYFRVRTPKVVIP